MFVSVFRATGYFSELFIASVAGAHTARGSCSLSLNTGLIVLYLTLMFFLRFSSQSLIKGYQLLSALLNVQNRFNNTIYFLTRSVFIFQGHGPFLLISRLAFIKSLFTCLNQKSISLLQTKQRSFPASSHWLQTRANFKVLRIAFQLLYGFCSYYLLED